MLIRTSGRYKDDPMGVYELLQQFHKVSIVGDRDSLC